VSPGGRDAVIYGMGSDPAEPARRSRRLLAQGRIVDAVAADLVVAGSAEELARRLGVGTRAFRSALRELVAVGWVVVNEGPAGRLAVRWERRQRRVPVAVERRRRAAR
jgi:DNA-binding FadR family transcriptional regulator